MLTLSMVEEREQFLEEITELVYSRDWSTRRIKRQIGILKKVLSPSLEISQTKWMEKFNERKSQLFETKEDKRLKKLVSKRNPFDLDQILRIFNQAKASAEYQALLAYEITPPVAPNFEEPKNLLNWTKMFRRWKNQILELIAAKSLQDDVDQSGLPPIGQVRHQLLQTMNQPIGGAV